MDAVSPYRWRPDRTDLFMLLVLLLVGVKYTFGLERVMDVALYDESSYLHMGTALRRDGLPGAESAPLYALWYYALSLAQSDPVRLYYLNYTLTTILPPLFLYALLRVVRVPVLAASALAAYFLITQANFVTWPRPSHFALLIVLASLALAVRARRASDGVLLLAVGALLASFVRPEYFLAFLLLMAAGAALLVAGRRQPGETATLRDWLPLGAAVLAAAVLLGAFGLPAFGKGGGERHLYAFEQHFALNWATWNHLGPDDPYNFATNFREIAAKYFGDAHTVGEAVRHNPGAFARHVTANVRFVIARFPGLFLHHEDIFLPPGKRFENLEARLTLLALAAFVVVRWQTWWPVLGENLRRHRRLLVCAALLCVPGAISIVEIYPHDHYMLLPGTLLIVAAAVLLRGREEMAVVVGSPTCLTARQTLLLGIGLLAVGPALSRGPEVNTPIAWTIHCIQGLGIREPVRLLDAEGGYDFYQTANYRRVAESNKDKPFDQFLAASGINMIVLTDRLNRDSRYAADPAWHAFLDHSEDAGFEGVPVPGGAATLFVRRELLASVPKAGP